MTRGRRPKTESDSTADGFPRHVKHHTLLASNLLTRNQVGKYLPRVRATRETRNVHLTSHFAPVPRWSAKRANRNRRKSALCAGPTQVFAWPLDGQLSGTADSAAAHTANKKRNLRSCHRQRCDFHNALDPAQLTTGRNSARCSRFRGLPADAFVRPSTRERMVPARFPRVADAYPLYRTST